MHLDDKTEDDGKLVGRDILVRAVYLGKTRLMRLLVEGGADINATNAKGQTALMTACIRKAEIGVNDINSKKIIRYLLDNNADPNIRDNEGKSVLMYACASNMANELIELLLQKGANPTLRDNSGKTAVTYAAEGQCKVVVQRLVSACRELGQDVVIIESDRISKKQTDENVESSEKTVNTSNDGLSYKRLNRTLRRGKRLPRQNSQSSDDEFLEECRESSSNLRHFTLPFAKRLPIIQGAPRTCLSDSEQDGDLLHSPRSTQSEPKCEKCLFNFGSRDSDFRRGSLPGTLTPLLGCPSTESLCSSKTGTPVDSPVMRRRDAIGLTGRILARRGSGTKIFDVLSATRPGTLPPLNVNLNPPIPDIPRANST